MTLSSALGGAQLFKAFPRDPVRGTHHVGRGDSHFFFLFLFLFDVRAEGKFGGGGTRDQKDVCAVAWTNEYDKAVRALQRLHLQTSLGPRPCVAGVSRAREPGGGTGVVEPGGRLHLHGGEEGVSSGAVHDTVGRCPHPDPVDTSLGTSVPPCDQGTDRRVPAAEVPLHVHDVGHRLPGGDDTPPLVHHTAPSTLHAFLFFLFSFFLFGTKKKLTPKTQFLFY